MRGLRRNINPGLSEQDAIEMLSQHIISRPVFEALFENYQFAASNPISRSMQKMLDLLDELRSTLPNDLQAAQDIVAKRNDLLASGKREAEAIRRKAEEDARQMVSETEIVVAARKKAKEVQGNAEIQARELRRVANEYCEDTLKRTEEAVALSLDEVRKARQRFKSIAK